MQIFIYKVEHFIFHSMKNKTGAYVRDGDKDFMVSKFKTIPVLRYQKPFWFVGDSLESVNDGFHYWLKLQTQGLLYLIAYWTYNNNNQKRI